MLNSRLIARTVTEGSSAPGANLDESTLLTPFAEDNVLREKSHYPVIHNAIQEHLLQVLWLRVISDSLCWSYIRHGSRSALNAQLEALHGVYCFRLLNGALKNFSTLSPTPLPFKAFGSRNGQTHAKFNVFARFFKTHAELNTLELWGC